MLRIKIYIKKKYATNEFNEKNTVYNFIKQNKYYLFSISLILFSKTVFKFLVSRNS